MNEENTVSLNSENTEKNMYSQKESRIFNAILDRNGAINFQRLITTINESIDFVALFNRNTPKKEVVFGYLANYNLEDNIKKDVYLPISQIDAFENISFLANSNSLFLENMKEFFEIFVPIMFPDSTLSSHISSEGSDDEIFFEIKLKSKAYCYYTYIKKLMDDVLWNQSFFSVMHKGILDFADIVTRDFFSDESIVAEVSQEPLLTEVSGLPEFNPLNIKFSIKANRDYSNNYDIISTILDFSRLVNFLFDIYEPISQEIWSLYEEQEKEMMEINTQSVNLFADTLSTRVVPVNSDTIIHKTGLKYLQNQKLTEVFVPFDKKKALLPEKTPVFIYIDSKSDWHMLPPVLSENKIPGLEFFGVFYYDTVEKVANNYIHYVYQQDKKTGENIGRYEASFDEKLFMDVIEDNYSEGHLLSKLEQSKLAVEKYPKIFSKTEIHFEKTNSTIKKINELEFSRQIYEDVNIFDKENVSHVLSTNDFVMTTDESGLFFVKGLPGIAGGEILLHSVKCNEEIDSSAFVTMVEKGNKSTDWSLAPEDKESLIYPTLLELREEISKMTEIPLSISRLMTKFVFKYEDSDIKNIVIFEIAKKTTGVNILTNQFNFVILGDIAYASYGDDIQFTFDATDLSVGALGDFFKEKLDIKVEENSDYFNNFNISSGTKLFMIYKDVEMNHLGGFLYNV